MDIVLYRRLVCRCEVLSDICSELRYVCAAGVYVWFLLRPAIVFADWFSMYRKFGLEDVKQTRLCLLLYSKSTSGPVVCVGLTNNTVTSICTAFYEVSAPGRCRLIIYSSLLQLSFSPLTCVWVVCTGYLFYDIYISMQCCRISTSHNLALMIWCSFCRRVHSVKQFSCDSLPVLVISQWWSLHKDVNALQKGRL